MSHSMWRIPINFQDQWDQLQKRVMRLERRPAITNAGQIMGPGAGPFAVQTEDWNDEACTFTGVFYSEKDSFNGPDAEVPLVGDYYWIGETFGFLNEDSERWGFQRVTRVLIATDTSGGSSSPWVAYQRRFFSQGDLVAYAAWDAV